MSKMIRTWALFMWTLTAAVGGAESYGAAPSLSDSMGGDVDKKPNDIRPQDVIDWAPFEAHRSASGDSIEVSFRMQMRGDWKVYTKNLTFAGPPGYQVTSVSGPKTQRILDPISGEEVDVYAGGEFQVTLTGVSPWTRENFPLDITYVGCTQSICLFPYTHQLVTPYVESPRETNREASSRPEAGGASQASPSPEPENRSTPEEATVSSLPTTDAAAPQTLDAKGASSLVPPSDAPTSADLETTLAKRLASGGLPFSLLLLLVFVGGLLSNLTPCVYPMIPITLRLLSKQNHAPTRSALLYAAGIVLTYTSLGLVAGLSGGLFGSLLASKPFNLLFAALMFVLGLSMLGFGDLSTLQVLGSRLGSGTPSDRNTFLMGAGAGLVAAPCTGPILAALLAYIAGKGEGVTYGVSLLFVYSVGFALPYVLLGSAAAHVSKIKVPAQFQVATKIIFSSVMFGLALYYLRVPLYGLFSELRPYWRPLTLGSFTGGLFATFLWLAFSQKADGKWTSLIPTLLLGMGVFSGSQWATSSYEVTNSLTLHWLKSEEEALALAARENKPILIDMWAEWCEACKKLDATTFKEPAVLSTLARDFILLKLDLTELDPRAEDIQKRYEVQSLPTLVVLPAQGDLKRKHAILGYVDGATLLQELEAFRSSNP